MTQIIDAVFENGILRPLERIRGIADQQHVRLSILSNPGRLKSVSDCIGILPDEDADEMRRIVEVEFEQVDLNEW